MREEKFTIRKQQKVKWLVAMVNSLAYRIFRKFRCTHKNPKYPLRDKTKLIISIYNQHRAKEGGCPGCRNLGSAKFILPKLFLGC